MPRVDVRATLETALPQQALAVRLVMHYVNDLRDQVDLEPITEAMLLQTLRALQQPQTEKGIA
jgi:hypothetical protein